MYNVSNAFRDTIRTSSTLIPRLEISEDKGVSWSDLHTDFYGGDVTCGGTAESRWNAQLVISDAVARTVRERMFGYRFRLFVGVPIPRIGVEEIPWGVYRPESWNVRTGALECMSFERQIALARFLKPRQFATQLGSDILKIIVEEAVPNTTFAWRTDRVHESVPGFIEQIDRMGVINGSDAGSSTPQPGIAKSLGITTFFDGVGSFVADDIVTVRDMYNPVWDLDEQPHQMKISDALSLSRDGVYNVIVVQTNYSDGRKPLGPVYVWDRNPSSPTFAGTDPVSNPRGAGPFGIVPRFYRSPFFTSTRQMEDTGRSLLADSISFRKTVSFDAIPNPALEPNDVIRVNGDLNIVESWKCSLSEPKMSLATREFKSEGGDVDVQTS